MELNFSMNRLVSNLRMATPDIDWNRAHRMRGDNGSSFADATSAAEQLGQLKNLEEFLGHSNAAQGLPEVDVESVRRNLGDDAARHVVRLQKALQGLRDQGFVDRQGSRLHLTPKGVRQIGQQALRDLFAQLRDSPTIGAHRTPTISRGGDREETSKPWQPGEPFALNLPKTLRNAVLRQGPGTPVKLHADDFEIEEFESTRRSATVFAIDLSLSMAMRSNLVPAKKMVLALTSLIRSKFPRDFVAVVGFGEMAQELKIEDIPALTIDYAYGTNLQHALALSRHLMRFTRPSKRPWPRYFGARRRGSRLTRSPSTSSAASSRSSNRLPKSTEVGCSTPTWTNSAPTLSTTSSSIVEPDSDFLLIDLIR